MKSACNIYKTEITISFDHNCSKSQDIVNAIYSSVNADAQFESSSTEIKTTSDSKLIIQVSTQNIADLRALINTNLRLINMAYLSISGI